MSLDVQSTLHLIVGLLLWPVIAGLLLLGLAALYDLGLALGEWLGGIDRSATRGFTALEKLARQRIRRADLLSRVGPTLGLMGTLIPLGPGIAALGRGDFLTLSQAVATAFDTTVFGLLVGLFGFLIGRFRRNAYESALNNLEASDAREDSHA
ncbi:MAG: MotA/TolQ/ExbB proton channel family protein [Pseudomonadota bacterium]